MPRFFFLVIFCQAFSWNHTWLSCYCWWELRYQGQNSDWESFGIDAAKDCVRDSTMQKRSISSKLTQLPTTHCITSNHTHNSLDHLCYMHSQLTGPLPTSLTTHWTTPYCTQTIAKHACSIYCESILSLRKEGQSTSHSGSPLLQAVTSVKLSFRFTSMNSNEAIYNQYQWSIP